MIEQGFVMKKLLFMVILLPGVLGAAAQSSADGVSQILRDTGQCVTLVTPLYSKTELTKFAFWLGSQSEQSIRDGLRYDDKGKGRAPSSGIILPNILRMIGTNVEVVGMFERAGQLRHFGRFIEAQSERDLQESLFYIVPDASQRASQRRSVRQSRRLSIASSPAARQQLERILQFQGEIQGLYQRLSEQFESECGGQDFYDIMRSDMSALFAKVMEELVPKVQSLPWVIELTSADQDMLLEAIVPLAVYKAGEVYLTMARENFRNIAEQEALERIAIDVGLKTVRYFLQHPEGGVAEACFAGDSVYEQRCLIMSELYYAIQQAQLTRPRLPHTISSPALSEPSSSSSSSSSQAGPSGPPQLIVTAQQLNVPLRHIEKDEEQKWEESGTIAQRARQGLRHAEGTDPLKFPKKHRLTREDYQKFAALPEHIQTQTRGGLTEKQKNQLTILEGTYGKDAGSVAALFLKGAAQRRHDIGAFKDSGASQSMPALGLQASGHESLNSSADTSAQRRPDEEAAAHERARKAQAAIDATKRARGGGFFAGITSGVQLRPTQIAARPVFDSPEGIPALGSIAQRAKEIADRESSSSEDDRSSDEWD
jgi:hypothetical protein